MNGLLDRMRKHHGLKADSKLGVKAAIADSIRTTKGANGLTEVVAVANTAAVDLSNDVVLPEGAARDKDGSIVYFGKAGAIFTNHNYDIDPIGTFRSASLQGKGADAKWVVRFVLHGRTPESKQIASLFELGDDNPIRGVSIGFIASDASEPTDEELGEYGPDVEQVIRKWTWLELSVTPAPCNPDAWIQSISTGKSVEIDGDTARGLERAMQRGIITKSTAGLLGYRTRLLITVPTIIEL